MTPEFAMAYAQSMDPAVGVAVRTLDGRYFCGFKQEDGSVAFGDYLQREQPVAAKKLYDEPEFAAGAPVFLFPIQMTERGLNAAIFAAVSEQSISKQFQEDDIRYCHEIFVKKDKTPDATKDIWAPGLASVEACKEGIDNGFLRLKDGFSYAAHSVRKSLQKVFCPKNSK